MKYLFRSALLAVVALVFVSCKSAPEETAPEWFREEACQFFGHNNVELFWVTSSGSMADSTFNALSGMTPSKTAMRLSEIMARGGLKQVDLAVSGPNSAKVRRVIMDAFDEQVTRLPKLYILYLGDPKEVAELEKKAVAANVRLYHIDKTAAELTSKGPSVKPVEPLPAQ